MRQVEIPVWAFAISGAASLVQAVYGAAKLDRRAPLSQVRVGRFDFFNRQRRKNFVDIEFRWTRTVLRWVPTIVACIVDPLLDLILAHFAEAETLLRKCVQLGIVGWGIAAGLAPMRQRFLGKGFDNVGMIDQLDDGRDISLSASARSHSSNRCRPC
jgi:hypothetical protein